MLDIPLLLSAKSSGFIRKAGQNIARWLRIHKLNFGDIWVGFERAGSKNQPSSTQSAQSQLREHRTLGGLSLSVKQGGRG
ncbi:MAG: hypothetical protein H6695_07480 [Deferribacteres bacterium]|nr:hypothetical protein [candidate division KSB1 bacterium]MCB9510005.1 hypothetical protein [Deferribacteres bacterium]